MTMHTTWKPLPATYDINDNGKLDPRERRAFRRQLTLTASSPSGCRRRPGTCISPEFSSRTPASILARSPTMTHISWLGVHDFFARCVRRRHRRARAPCRRT